jgi:hypothetical protein
VEYRSYSRGEYMGKQECTINWIDPEATVEEREAIELYS